MSADQLFNRTFKADSSSAAPYYYVRASLDLAGAVDGGVYYFNHDNNFNYASVREYNNYVVIDENSIIGEVVVYSNNDFVAADAENAPEFAIGGAAHPSVGGGVQVRWAAPAGSTPGLGADLTMNEVNAGSVHLYGHEGGHWPYNQPNANTYKFLAVEVNPGQLAPQAGRDLTRSEKRKIRRIGRSLPVGNLAVEEGKLTVVLKVYPKFQ